ncbi:Uncharacterized protein OS=Pirellula staleyi (strain ATCC 27377 / DSM 6068 / ICPB 4128) GN=Psta_1770 PE=4 SV=1: Ceramidase_alk [Gemmata massiliana]|uniref:Uncharacterized protein n=1 Tax=Gemmata massiliana TaxID=1210884 RepID=A0A6P2D5N5_9BACT|nr:hypothetical protein [Gemmata massiliana]VTR95786.1 Uncharacterized protein OS=Pirellula staleyi (strain ATCC 27377 / DSM 6068 / ICPB 4128) GN=Psta_1770 PE=4 SV=1: Ceramidase_alk [Gemmata massiliana]
MRFASALCVLLSFALPGSAGEFSVGFGEVDVTPEVGKRPVYIAGFGQNRKATKVHDPITARAVVMGDGDEKIAFVSVDVIGLFLPSVERIREKVTGFKYVLVSATHNHEGPDTLGLWGPTPIQTGIDADYQKKLETGCADAIRAADKARTPATVRIGKVSDPDLLLDNRKPVVKHDELVVLQFREPKTNKPLGMLVQWNCHPESLDSRNTEISADFIHYTVKHLRESHKCPVAYFTGTVGGLMTTLKLPIKDEKGKELADGTFEKTERYGRLVAVLADKALKDAVPVKLTPFTVRTQALLVPVENAVYRLGWSLGTLDRTMYAWEGTPTPKKFTATKDVTKPVAVKTEVGYLKLGDLEIAAIPGEIYPELVLGKVQNPADPGADFPDAPIEPAVYDQLKGKHRMLIGLANDELGYFIPKRQWDDKAPFCYGLKKSQYGEMNSVGPEAAPIICGTFKELAKGK